MGGFTHIHTHIMSIDACIAHAIHNDLDIVEVLPEIHDIPMEDLEQYVEQYVVKLQDSLRDVVRDQGEPFIRAKDAAGLCAIVQAAGVALPARMLLNMCQTIIRLSELDARFILDTEEGVSLYYMKMELA